MKSQRISIRHARKQEVILWVIDSDQWPRACLRAELIERGYDPYGFIKIADALNSLSRGASKPDLIILELRDQNLDQRSLDAIQNLEIPTIVLGGNMELNEPVIHQHRWDMVIKRPVSLGEIADAVERIVSPNRASV